MFTTGRNTVWLDGLEDIYLSVHFVDLNAITPMCSKKDMTVDQLLIIKGIIIHMKIRTSEEQVIPKYIIWSKYP